MRPNRPILPINFYRVTIQTQARSETSRSTARDQQVPDVFVRLFGERGAKAVTLTSLFSCEWYLLGYIMNGCFEQATAVLAISTDSIQKQLALCSSNQPPKSSSLKLSTFSTSPRSWLRKGVDRTCQSNASKCRRRSLRLRNGSLITMSKSCLSQLRSLWKLFDFNE